jgi:predicted transcriptional regulator
MMMRRSKNRIISEILDVCRTGANKTRIVYQANLNFNIVNPYLDLLIKNDLLEVKPGKNASYETTDKGISFLDNLNQINSYFLKGGEADLRTQSIILDQEA